MTSMRFPYSTQSIDPSDIAAMEKSLLQPMITRGEQVEEFEKALANYCGAQYAVAFNSGTAALMAAYTAAEVKKGDRVITTPNSFVASIGPAIQRGAHPLFVDIDRSTGNLNLNQVKEILQTPLSRRRYVVTPVHFSGIPVEMQIVEQMIEDPEGIIIEDAAHALGSTYSDGTTKVGSCRWSDLTIFSFHPAKIITTGEGGAVTTNNPDLYRRLRLFRNNGIERDPTYLKNPKAASPHFYEVQELSGNYNFTEFQAALGLSQLKRIDSFIAQRRKLVALYRQELASTPQIRLFSPQYDAHTAFHLFVIQIDFSACKITRKKCMEELNRIGIGSQVHYIPIYHHPFFQGEMGRERERFPQMEAYYQEALSLPLYPALQEEDILYIVKNLKMILS